jgi:hypothetical protein
MRETLIRGISVAIVIDPIIGNFFFAGVNTFVIVVAVTVIVDQAFGVATIAGAWSESIAVPVVVGVGIEGAGGVFGTYDTWNGVTGDVAAGTASTFAARCAGQLWKGGHAAAAVPVRAPTLQGRAELRIVVTGPRLTRGAGGTDEGGQGSTASACVERTAALTLQRIRAGAHQDAVAAGSAAFAGLSISRCGVVGQRHGATAGVGRGRGDTGKRVGAGAGPESSGAGCAWRLRKAEQAAAGISGGFTELFACVTVERWCRCAIVFASGFERKLWRAAGATGIEAGAIPRLTVSAASQAAALQCVFASAGQHAPVAGAASVTGKTRQGFVAATCVLFGCPAPQRPQGSATPDTKSALTGVNRTHKPRGSTGRCQGFTAAARVGGAARANNVGTVAGPGTAAAIAGPSQNSGVSGTSTAGVQLIAFTHKTRGSALPDAGAARATQLANGSPIAWLPLSGTCVNFGQRNALIFHAELCAVTIFRVQTLNFG